MSMHGFKNNDSNNMTIPIIRRTTTITIVKDDNSNNDDNHYIHIYIHTIMISVRYYYGRAMTRVTPF